MGFDGRGRRVVEERVLLEYYRQLLGGWPIHQYRMRALLASEGKNDG